MYVKVSVYVKASVYECVIGVSCVHVHGGLSTCIHSCTYMVLVRYLLFMFS